MIWGGLRDRDGLIRGDHCVWSRRRLAAVLCLRAQEQGTQAQNLADMCAKGRSARGERSGPRRHPEKYPRGEAVHGARLTEADIKAIRESPLATRALAEQLGLSREHVRDIRARRRWKHVP